MKMKSKHKKLLVGSALWAIQTLLLILLVSVMTSPPNAIVGIIFGLWMIVTLAAGLILVVIWVSESVDLIRIRIKTFFRSGDNEHPFKKFLIWVNTDDK